MLLIELCADLSRQGDIEVSIVYAVKYEGLPTYFNFMNGRFLYQPTLFSEICQYMYICKERGQ